VKVSVLAFDLADNATGRAELLARLLRPRYEVEVVGPQFGPARWRPAQGGPVTYRAVRAVLPRMLATGQGRIVTIASILGRLGGFGFVTAYAASKHGVIGLTRALAAELGAQGHPGITVNAVCPGYTRAGMGIALQATPQGPVRGDEIFERYYRRLVPQRRMMEAEEIAHAALFLALPESAGITGQALNVDGGFLMS